MKMPYFFFRRAGHNPFSSSQHFFMEKEKCPRLAALLANCTLGALAGDYTALPDRSFQFKSLRAASKLGVFGSDGKHVELSVRSKKGAPRGGVVINGTLGHPETYIKICTPSGLKRTVRVLRYQEDGWAACALEGIKDKKTRLHVIEWCSLALGVSKEVWNEHGSAATELDAYVVAHEKAKKNVARLEAALKRCHDKKDEAVLALNDAYDGLQSAKKKAKTRSDASVCKTTAKAKAKANKAPRDAGERERKQGDATNVDEDDDGDKEADDGDGDDDDDVEILKRGRDLYREAAQALRAYRKGKKAAKTREETPSGYKAAKEAARRLYKEKIQEISIVRKSNRRLLREMERADLLTTVSHAASRGGSISNVLSLSFN